jgi:hypothetical protein
VNHTANDFTVPDDDDDPFEGIRSPEPGRPVTVFDDVSDERLDEVLAEFAGGVRGKYVGVDFKAGHHMDETVLVECSSTPEELAEGVIKANVVIHRGDQYEEHLVDRLYQRLEKLNFESKRPNRVAGSKGKSMTTRERKLSERHYEELRDKEATDARSACVLKGHVWSTDYNLDDDERICRRCGVEGVVKIVERYKVEGTITDLQNDINRKLNDKVDVVETKDVWCSRCDARCTVRKDYEGKYYCSNCKRISES